MNPSLFSTPTKVKAHQRILLPPTNAEVEPGTTRHSGLPEEVVIGFGDLIFVSRAAPTSSAAAPPSGRLIQR
jgi:hypothetical protein